MPDFTPGPWSMYPGRTFIALEDTRDRELATVWNDSDIKVSEMQANAHLISAAHDMYKALDQVESYLLEMSATDEDLLDVVQGALSKALGKE